MKKILIIGTVDETHKNISGQYDRTEIIRDGLRKKGYLVKFINMINWKKQPFKVLGTIIRDYYRVDAAIFLASLNGTRVILNIVSAARVIKKIPVYQIAIGGQSNFKFVRDSKWYRRKIDSLAAVFVELESMVGDYNSIGLTKVYYLPNCKTVTIDKEALDNASLQIPYRFCTYSRVTPEKGIAEAISVVESINNKFGKHICTLDIYGTYLDEDREWFKSLMNSATSAITFKGKIERKESISILSQYDLMLFPTRHIGEGVPGGMIDCYEAGLPIVTCNTSYMKNIVHDGNTGFVYDRNEKAGLEKAIMRYIDDCDLDLKRMLRKNCQDEARKYDITEVILTLSKHIG